MVVSWGKQETCTAILDIFRYSTDPARDNGEPASACFEIHQSGSFRPERWAHKTICCLHKRCDVFLQAVKAHPRDQVKLRAQLAKPFRLVAVAYNPENNALR